MGHLEGPAASSPAPRGSRTWGGRRAWGPGGRPATAQLGTALDPPRLSCPAPSGACSPSLTPGQLGSRLGPSFLWGGSPYVPVGPGPSQDTLLPSPSQGPELKHACGVPGPQKGQSRALGSGHGLWAQGTAAAGQGREAPVPVAGWFPTSWLSPAPGRWGPSQGDRVTGTELSAGGGSPDHPGGGPPPALSLRHPGLPRPAPPAAPEWLF